MDTIVNDTRLTDTNKMLRKLGQESAHSALAKPKMALTIAQARADGVLTDDAGQSTYDTYLEGRRAVLSKTSLGVGDSESTSMKANVSKNTQILKASGLIAAGVDFVDVLTRATALREDLAKVNEKVKPTFDCYVDLARAQLKAPTEALQDDAITEVIRKKDPITKDELAKLIDTYKRVYKQANEIKIEALQEAVANIATAISELGGEVPAMTKEEKEAAAAMAYMVKMGFKVVQSAAADAAVTEENTINV